jgi:uncharacterized protein YbjT (DUF2867 family)
MILIAGGTGTLGTEVVRLLTSRGLEVRILTRDPDRAEHERGDLVEIVSGDVRDARTVERAVAGPGPSSQPSKGSPVPTQPAPRP